jgi:hypothetical protein
MKLYECKCSLELSKRRVSISSLEYEKGGRRLLESTVKPVLNGPVIKRNLVLKGNIFRSRDYHSKP